MHVHHHFNEAGRKQNNFGQDVLAVLLICFNSTNSLRVYAFNGQRDTDRNKFNCSVSEYNVYWFSVCVNREKFL